MGVNGRGGGQRAYYEIKYYAIIIFMFLILSKLCFVNILIMFMSSFTANLIFILITNEIGRLLNLKLFFLLFRSIENKSIIPRLVHSLSMLRDYYFFQIISHPTSYSIQADIILTYLLYQSWTC